MRGMGRVYLRGKVWWIRYWHRGKEYRESSHSERQIDAERRLKSKWKDIGRGRFVGPSEERFTVNQLLDAVVVSYRNDARRTLLTLPSRLKVLRETFGEHRAVDVTPERIERFKSDLLEERTAGTVNRALSLLRRAFRLGVEQERLSSAPKVTLLAEQHNVREGFLDPGDFDAVVPHLPAYLQDFARFA